MIVIATCDQFDHPTPSLEVLLQSLKDHGAAAAHKPWKTTPIEEFAAADLVLPLCFWDHHGALRHFLDWINALEQRNVRVCNHPDILRWNFRKTYLLDLQGQNLATPETLHISEISSNKIASAMDQRDWPQAVVKPVSGQNGQDVIMLKSTERETWVLPKYPGGEALLQAFQAEITELGETTLTFIDGEYSHAVRRNLRPGEWRANLQFGTEPEAVNVSAKTVSQARRYLDAVPGTPLYARVDGLDRASGFILMELELIDPYLYFEFAPQGAEMLAKALLRRNPATR